MRIVELYMETLGRMKRNKAFNSRVPPQIYRLDFKDECGQIRYTKLGRMP